MAMCELNNTGVPSAYANSYVASGGSYDDFLTARTISLTGDDVMSGTATFSDSTSSSGSFDIGAAIINSASLTLNNYDDRFAGIDFTGASVRAYIGVPIEPVEWITKGYYTVDKPTSIGNTIPLTMLDNMSKFEKPYKNVTQLYPATLYDIAHSICTYCGVVLNDASFPNSDFEIPVRPDDTNMTCLAMISYVAQIAGCYARVNRFGYLEFKWYSMDVFESEGESYDGGTFSYADGDALDGGTFAYDDGDSADGGTFVYGEYYSCYALSTFSVGTEDIVVSGIRVVVDSDNEVAVGADGYVLEISDNPLVTADNMATVANYLGNQLVGMKFRPFNVSALSEPSVEAGDTIRINDSKGNYYDSFITTCSYKFGNYESFACNAQTVSENNSTSYSPITKAVEKARKESEKALSSYDLGVIRMNEIAMNAMGYYSSYTENLDGSRISYIHNKPTREESTIIWQSSASGFFLSTDGGETWASGWDANGNAVLNILYAIGIVCDWIKGGTLTLGGDNNVNGLMRVLNAAGSQVCKIDQTGIDAIAGTIGGFDIGATRLGASGTGLYLDTTNKMFEAWTAARNTRMTPGSLKINAGGSSNGVDVYNDSTEYIRQHTTMRDNGFAIYDVNGTQKMSLTAQQLYFNNDLSTINADGHGFFLAELISLVYYWRDHGGW
jgi:hypothetical protein